MINELKSPLNNSFHLHPNTSTNRAARKMNKIRMAGIYANILSIARAIYYESGKN
jgi:hypothetical protein